MRGKTEDKRYSTVISTKEPTPCDHRALRAVLIKVLPSLLYITRRPFVETLSRHKRFLVNDRRYEMKLFQYGLEQTEEHHPKLVEERSFMIKKELFRSPGRLADLISTCYGDYRKKAEEYVYMIALTSAMMPLGIFEISHGTCSSCLVSPRELMIRGLLCGAAYMAVIHNHPSGDVTPSKADMDISIKIRNAGALIDIRLIDFIILGDDIFSFSEHNMLS